MGSGSHHIAWSDEAEPIERHTVAAFHARQLRRRRASWARVKPCRWRSFSHHSKVEAPNGMS